MDLAFNKNEDVMKMACSQVKQHLEKIYEGGGKESAAKQKERNKLTARERIAYLCDEDSHFTEIGAFAGFDMYPEEGGCPAGGTVSGIGLIVGNNYNLPATYITHAAYGASCGATAFFRIHIKTGKSAYLCKRCIGIT